jgi:hypothetical protein
VNIRFNIFQDLPGARLQMNSKLQNAKQDLFGKRRIKFGSYWGLEI